MDILTKADILKAVDNRTKKVDCPEWGGSVLVSTMSGFARDQFEGSIVGKGGGTNTTNIRAKLAVATVVDEQGNLIFNEKDIAALGKKSAVALDRIFSASQELNKITDDDVEDMAKN